MLHRDLSSQNILLTNDGHIKIADFGCARKINERGEYKTTSITGSPAYMAPEQLEGHILTLKCDMWAVVRTQSHTYLLCYTHIHTHTLTHGLMSKWGTITGRESVGVGHTEVAVG